MREEGGEETCSLQDVLREGDNFIFPCADVSVKLAGKGPEVRPSNRIRRDIEEGEEHRSDLQGNQILQCNNENKTNWKQSMVYGRFHPVRTAEQHSTSRTHVVWEEIDKGSGNVVARTYGQKFGQVCQRNLSKKKNSIGQKRSPKLDNARKLRGY